MKSLPFPSHKGQTLKKNCQPFHISIMLNIYSNAKLNQQKCIFPMNEKWLKQTT